MGLFVRLQVYWQFSPHFFSRTLALVVKAIESLAEKPHPCPCSTRRRCRFVRASFSLSLSLFLSLVEPQRRHYNSGQGAPVQVVGGRTWLLLRHNYIYPAYQYDYTGNQPTSSQSVLPDLPQSNTILFHPAPSGCFIYCSGLPIPLRCSLSALRGLYP